SESLPEGEERKGGKAARDDGVPEREDGDAAIPAVADGVERQADTSLCRSPGLNPGDASGSQFGDDPLGALFVEVRPSLGGPACACLCHRNVSATGEQRASLAALHPSRPPGRTLTLSGALRGAAPLDRGRLR